MPTLKGKEKALIFLSSLGDEVSKKVLNCLPEKLSMRITEELNNFPKPTPEAVALVFRELNKFALNRTENPRLTGPVDSEAQIEHIDSLSQLGRKGAKELLAILQNEQPQTVAFVLSYLSKTKQNTFYELLSPGRRNEIKQAGVEKIQISDRIFEKINEYLVKTA